MKTKNPSEITVESFGPLPSPRMFRQFLEQIEKREVRDLPAKDATKLLKDRLKNLRKSHEFKVGDIVTWKPGLRNRNRPQHGQPAIVVEVLETPKISETEGPGHISYREPLDLVLGILDRDRDFVCFHYDSRRFQYFKDGSNSKSGN